MLKIGEKVDLNTLRMLGFKMKPLAYKNTRLAYNDDTIYLISEGTVYKQLKIDKSDLDVISLGWVQIVPDSPIYEAKISDDYIHCFIHLDDGDTFNILYNDGEYDKHRTKYFLIVWNTQQIQVHRLPKAKNLNRNKKDICYIEDLTNITGIEIYDDAFEVENYFEIGNKYACTLYDKQGVYIMHMLYDKQSKNAITIHKGKKLEY